MRSVSGDSAVLGVERIGVTDNGLVATGIEGVVGAVGAVVGAVVGLATGSSGAPTQWPLQRGYIKGSEALHS